MHTAIAAATAGSSPYMTLHTDRIYRNACVTNECCVSGSAVEGALRENLFDNEEPSGGARGLPGRGAAARGTVSAPQAEHHFS